MIWGTKTQENSRYKAEGKRSNEKDRINFWTADFGNTVLTLCKQMKDKITYVSTFEGGREGFTPQQFIECFCTRFI